MAVIRQVDAQMIGRLYAEMVEDDPDVQEIYVRPFGDSIEVWMLTSHSNYDAEDAIFDAAVAVQRRVPDTRIDLHVVNPRHYPTTCDLVRDIIPDNAVAVPAT
ncbi:MAG TPA: hypothetical protein VFV93_10085 [Thermomicrobiales bacterium]|nr:hypothetical protein [Thermomicrobiales bacterium]